MRILMKSENYGRLLAGLIAAWFVFALTGAALGLFHTSATRPPLPLLLAVLLPLVIFTIWYQSSLKFRDFVLSINPGTLTLVQSWRIAGYTFLVLYAYGILPGIFALPAGWGDVAIGLTAPLIATKFAFPGHRKSFIVWQVLGITDLVVAVTSGAAAPFLFPQTLISARGPNTGDMTALPLSLIPTFAVPLLGILHIICIAQARRWSEAKQPRLTENVPLSV
jgi:hypothetical protein